MKTPKAIIFDMDGLMIDSERVTRDSYRKALQELGLEMSDAFYASLLGKNQRQIYARINEEYGSDFDADALYKRVHQLNNELYDSQGVPVKKGLRELLAYLQEQDIPRVIATSSERRRVEDILKRTGLTDLFNDMICGDEIVKGKPNPEIFLKAAAKAGVSPQDGLVLEDSYSGMEAGAAAGIPVICVVDLVEPDEAHLGLVEKRVDSLLDVLDEIRKED